MLPNIVLLVVVVLGCQTAVSNNQRWCVPDVRRLPQLGDIVIHFQCGNVMFNTRATVYHEIHIHVVQRSSFGNNKHVLLTSSFDDLLALLSARLIVVFNTNRTLSFQPSNVR